MKPTLLIAALASLAPLTATFAQAMPDFDTAQPSIGSWGYQAVAGGSIARFVDTSGIARVTMQCSRAARQVTIAHTSAAPSATMLVWTSSQSRSIASLFDQKGMRVTANLAATDPLLDALAFSRGRFALQLAGSPPLVIPTSPEAARVVEDCRT